MLNEERKYMVHLPKGYEKSKSRYPVLYILDADWEELYVNSVTGAAYLNEFGQVPKLIVVGILNTVRDRDMIPVKMTERRHSGGSDKFLDFITKELKPQITNDYRTEPYTILYGGSNAGLFALYAFLEGPPGVDASIAGSPMIGHCRDYIYQRTEALFEKGGRSGGFLFLIYGEDDFPKVVDFVPDYDRFLKSNSPSFAYETRTLENEGHVPLASLSSGLRFIFRDWEFPQSQRAQATLKDLEQHYHQANKTYGFNSEIPLDLLIESGYRSIEGGNTADAIEVLEYATLAHPYSPDAFYYLATAYEKDDKLGLAMEHCKKVLEVDPDYRMAAEKIEALKKAEQRP
jgi:tetratricopeptide (TPR) repeat protein